MILKGTNEDISKAAVKSIKIIMVRDRKTFARQLNLSHSLAMN